MSLITKPLSAIRTLFNLRKIKPNEVDHVSRAYGISSGVYVNEDTSMKVSAFYRGVNYVTTQFSKLPIRIIDDQNREVSNRTSRKVYNLLNISANPEMSAFFWKIKTMYDAIMHGNSFSEIERDALGDPIALWPIDSKDVELWRMPEGNLIYRIIGGTGTYRQADVYLRPEEVFHVKNFHTKDGLVGQGVVAYAQTVLGISISADGMAGNSLANGGMPSGALKVKGTLSEEAAKNLRDSWVSAHGGKKTGGTAVLEEGVEYQSISHAPEELQCLDTRKFGVPEIARFLGVPLSKMYDQSGNSYNNSENSHLEFSMDTLDPWAVNFESEANIKLLRTASTRIYSDVDIKEVSRGDMTTRSNYFNKMMQVGAMSSNEIRLKESMAPYEGGDRYYIAVNNFSPADRIDEIVDAQVNKNGENQGQERLVDPPDTQVENKLEEAAIKYLEGK